MDRTRITRYPTGFTMVELMFAVVVLGILVGVAAVALSKNLRKARANEVYQMFAELQAREEAYRSLNGSYLSTAAEGAYFPTTITGGTDKTSVVGGVPETWRSLKIDTAGGGLYCQYAAIAGRANDATNLGTLGATLYTGTPAYDWYYLLAQCDWDADPSVNSIYARRGDRTDTYKINEGR